MSNRNDEFHVLVEDELESPELSSETASIGSSSSDQAGSETTRLAAREAREEARHNRETIDTLRQDIRELKEEKSVLEAEFSPFKKNAERMEKLSKYTSEQKKTVEGLQDTLDQMSASKEFMLKALFNQDLVQFLNLPPYLQLFSEMSLSFPKELRELHALLKEKALQTGVSRKELARDLSDWIAHLGPNTLQIETKYSSYFEEFQRNFGEKNEELLQSSEHGSQNDETELLQGNDEKEKEKLYNPYENPTLRWVLLQELKRYEHLPENAEPWMPNDISFLHRVGAFPKSTAELKHEEVRRPFIVDRLVVIEAAIARREKKLGELMLKKISAQSFIGSDPAKQQSHSGGLTPRA